MPAQHHQVSRLEGFSDAVFGFALTLLVVSLEVPSTVEALESQMQGFLGFALMFAMVCWIWYEHNWFFRRTGLQDPWTVFLNCVLLFVVLFYVYPLKFLTAALLSAFFGLGEPGGPSFRSGGSGASVMIMYSTGVVLIFGVFVLLYRHARRRRHMLDLSAADEVALAFGMRGHVISLSLGAASIATALLGDRLAPVAGFIFMLMGPLHAWNGSRAAKAHAALTGSPAPDRSGN